MTNNSSERKMMDGRSISHCDSTKSLRPEKWAHIRDEKVGGVNA